VLVSTKSTAPKLAGPSITPTFTGLYNTPLEERRSAVPFGTPKTGASSFRKYRFRIVPRSCCYRRVRETRAYMVGENDVGTARGVAKTERADDFLFRRIRQSDKKKYRKPRGSDCTTTTLRARVRRWSSTSTCPSAGGGVQLSGKLYIRHGVALVVFPARNDRPPGEITFRLGAHINTYSRHVRWSTPSAAVDMRALVRLRRVTRLADKNGGTDDVARNERRGNGKNVTSTITVQCRRGLAISLVVFGTSDSDEICGTCRTNERGPKMGTVAR